jgi:hypothetical protein
MVGLATLPASDFQHKGRIPTMQHGSEKNIRTKGKYKQDLREANDNLHGFAFDSFFILNIKTSRSDFLVIFEHPGAWQLGVLWLTFLQVPQNLNYS